MRLLAGILGVWCLVVAGALVVVLAIPSDHRVVHIVRVEGGASLTVEGGAEVRARGGIDLRPGTIVVRGLPGMAP